VFGFATICISRSRDSSYFLCERAPILLSKTPSLSRSALLSFGVNIQPPKDKSIKSSTRAPNEKKQFLLERNRQNNLISSLLALLGKKNLHATSKD